MAKMMTGISATHSFLRHPQALQAGITRTFPQCGRTAFTSAGTDDGLIRVGDLRPVLPCARSSIAHEPLSACEERLILLWYARSRGERRREYFFIGNPKLLQNGTTILLRTEKDVADILCPLPAGWSESRIPPGNLRTNARWGAYSLPCTSHRLTNRSSRSRCDCGPASPP
jgi:hypothetical protein